ncbi:hypothetical protein [Asanoa ferruginea]|uniref:hypothetical protein n=1 Tax=Asanoa ferruginea TaxID=53367 RepID=UPI0011C18DFE|nr:hypothetical protein [Asanoa ferruginea]
MTAKQIEGFLADAPAPIRRELSQYARGVQNLASKSFGDAGCKRPTADERSVFVIVATFRKLAHLIDFQSRTIRATTRAGMFSSIAVGSVEITGDSAYDRQLRRMSNDLWNTAQEIGIRDLLASSTLKSLARKVHERNH